MTTILHSQIFKFSDGTEECITNNFIKPKKSTCNKESGFECILYFDENEPLFRGRTLHNSSGFAYIEEGKTYSDIEYDASFSSYSAGKRFLYGQPLSERDFKKIEQIRNKENLVELLLDSNLVIREMALIRLRELEKIKS